LIPKVGAKVLFFQESAWFQTDSGPEGRFEIQIQPQILDRIAAVSPPHPIAVLGPIPIAWDRDTFVEIALPEPLSVRRVTGRVLDADGKPVSGALLTVRAPSKIPTTMGKLWVGGPWLLPTTKSDSQGNFSIEALPQSKAQLDVQAEGFEPYQETLDTTKDVEKYVFLKRPEIFRVVVVDARGRLIIGMKAVGDTEDNDMVLYPASTEGEYYSVKYPFRIYAEGIHSNQGITHSKRIEKYQKQVVLVLGHATIGGVVTQEDGNPVTGFSIYVREIGDSTFSGRSAYFFRSLDGSFTLNNIPSGKASITIGLPPVTVPAGLPRPLMGLPSVPADIVVEEGRTAFVRAVLKQK
jgi:hypothetical protein